MTVCVVGEGASMHDGIKCVHVGNSIQCMHNTCAV